jgi:hypothetical protein
MAFHLLTEIRIRQHGITSSPNCLALLQPDTLTLQPTTDWSAITAKFKGINMEIDPNDYETRCNILLSMWMDNILTDKQYYEIRAKLDKFEAERRKGLSR